MHHLRTACIALALALVATPALADRTRIAGEMDRDANDSFFVEGLGSGVLYSVNYERIVEDYFGLRIGFSYQAFSAAASSGGSTASGKINFLTVPVMVNYLGIRAGNHALEMGFGGTMIYANGAATGTGINVAGSGMGALGTAALGYRRQPPNGGFMFRIGVEALVGKGLSLDANADPNKVGVLPWLYMSLGFSL